jgi:hypothetical protein
MISGRVDPLSIWDAVQNIYEEIYKWYSSFVPYFFLHIGKEKRLFLITITISRSDKFL